jgi:hypothetical protein
VGINYPSLFGWGEGVSLSLELRGEVTVPLGAAGYVPSELKITATLEIFFWELQTT